MAFNTQERITQLKEATDGSESLLDILAIRVAVFAGLIVLALIIALPVAGHLSNPETYRGTVQSLQKSQDVATDFMMTTAAASTAVTIVGPDDWGGGVANELADISGDFAIVLAAILLEKHGMTVIGLIACRLLIPLGLAALAIAVLLGRRGRAAVLLETFARRMIPLAIVLVIAIPCAVYVSGLMNDAYNSATDNRIEKVQQDLGAFTRVVDEAKEGDDLIEKVSGMAGALFDGVTKLPDIVQNLVSGVIEVFAMMIVLNCIVPILVVLLLIWMANIVLGANITIPKGAAHMGSAVRKRMLGARSAQGE